MSVLRPIAISAALVSLLASGCATKKHVRNTVEPIDRRVSDVEAKSKKTDTAVSDLERGLALTDERARGADTRATAAGAEAAKANAAAGQANEAATKSGQLADTANRTATDARGQANTANAKVTALDERITKMDELQLLFEENVLFKFNSSQLSPDAKKQLESAVGRLREQKKFIVEVHGYTDKTGNVDYNKQLSRRRADAVAQFLTLDQKIPLHRVFMQGAGVFGSEQPVNGQARELREQSRRVEIKVFTPKAN
jgi:outer membrane protein OmpA-like peptidoglycan-associated protein